MAIDPETQKSIDYWETADPDGSRAKARREREKATLNGGEATYQECKDGECGKCEPCLIENGVIPDPDCLPTRRR